MGGLGLKPFVAEAAYVAGALAARAGFLHRLGSSARAADRALRTILRLEKSVPASDTAGSPAKSRERREARPSPTRPVRPEATGASASLLAPGRRDASERKEEDGGAAERGGRQAPGGPLGHRQRPGRGGGRGRRRRGPAGTG